MLLVGVRVPAAEAAEKKVEASSEVQRQQLADQTNEGTIWPGAQNNRSPAGAGGRASRQGHWIRTY